MGAMGNGDGESRRGGPGSFSEAMRLVLPRGPLGAMAPRSGIYRIGL